MPIPSRPWIRKIRRYLSGVPHPARRRSFELGARNGGRRHQSRARRLSKYANRIVIIRRRPKAAVPPCVVKRVSKNAFEAGGGNVCGHLVTNQSDLSKQKRRDVRIRRVIKRRHKETRAI